MEKIIEKLGIYDMLCALVGGVLCIMSVKLLDISFFRFIFANVPDSMHLVFLVFVGSFVGTVLQEIGSKLEHRKKLFASCRFFRFRDFAITNFLILDGNKKSGATENTCTDNDESALDNTVGKNAVFDNGLEIKSAREKAFKLLPERRDELSETHIFSDSESQYVFHKMNKSISQKEGSSTIEMINALSSLSRSLCVWFCILALLYFVDAFFKQMNNEPFTIPYPTTEFCYKVVQIIIIIIGLIVLAAIMYNRAERYQHYRLRSIVRLYAYYDDNRNGKDVENDEGTVH